MGRFVILTIEGHGVKGAFAGTCPPGFDEQDAFRWAMPLARQQISPFGQDDVAVLYFKADPVDGA
jgi:hypothetical protein